MFHKYSRPRRSKINSINADTTVDSSSSSSDDEEEDWNEILATRKKQSTNSSWRVGAPPTTATKSLPKRVSYSPPEKAYPNPQFLPADDDDDDDSTENSISLLSTRKRPQDKTISNMGKQKLRIDDDDDDDEKEGGSDDNETVKSDDTEILMSRILQNHPTQSNSTNAGTERVTTTDKNDIPQQSPQTNKLKPTRQRMIDDFSVTSDCQYYDRDDHPPNHPAQQEEEEELGDRSEETRKSSGKRGYEKEESEEESNAYFNNNEGEDDQSSVDTETLMRKLTANRGGDGSQPCKAGAERQDNNESTEGTFRRENDPGEQNTQEEDYFVSVDTNTTRIPKRPTNKEDRGTMVSKIQADRCKKNDEEENKEKESCDFDDEEDGCHVAEGEEDQSSVDTETLMRKLVNRPSSSYSATNSEIQRQQPASPTVNDCHNTIAITQVATRKEPPALSRYDDTPTLPFQHEGSKIIQRNTAVAANREMTALEEYTLPEFADDSSVSSSSDESNREENEKCVVFHGNEQQHWTTKTTPRGSDDPLGDSSCPQHQRASFQQPDRPCEPEQFQCPQQSNVTRPPQQRPNPYKSDNNSNRLIQTTSNPVRCPPDQPLPSSKTTDKASLNNVSQQPQAQSSSSDVVRSHTKCFNPYKTNHKNRVLQQTTLDDQLQHVRSSTASTTKETTNPEISNQQKTSSRPPVNTSPQERTTTKANSDKSQQPNTSKNQFDKQDPSTLWISDDELGEAAFLGADISSRRQQKEEIDLTCEEPSNITQPQQHQPEFPLPSQGIVREGLRSPKETLRLDRIWHSGSTTPAAQQQQHDETIDEFPNDDDDTDAMAFGFSSSASKEQQPTQSNYPPSRFVSRRMDGFHNEGSSATSTWTNHGPPVGFHHGNARIPSFPTSTQMARPSLQQPHHPTATSNQSDAIRTIMEPPAKSIQPRTLPLPEEWNSNHPKRRKLRNAAGGNSAVAAAAVVMRRNTNTSQAGGRLGQSTIIQRPSLYPAAKTRQSLLKSDGPTPPAQARLEDVVRYSRPPAQRNDLKGGSGVGAGQYEIVNAYNDEEEEVWDSNTHSAQGRSSRGRGRGGRRRWGGGGRRRSSRGRGGGGRGGRGRGGGGRRGRANSARGGGGGNAWTDYGPTVGWTSTSTHDASTLGHVGGAEISF